MKKILFLFFLLNAFADAPDPTKPIVIGKMNGRLGNQLFNIAITCALAWDHDAEPYFPDLSILENDPVYPDNYRHLLFRCNVTPPSRPISFHMFEPPGGYRPILFYPDMKTEGWFMSEKYFAPHRDRLLELLAPHPDDLLYVQSNYSWLSKHSHTVGIPLRVWNEDPTGKYFLQYGKDFLRKAAAFFHEDTIYLVTSNDIEFAKKVIPAEMRHVVIIEKEPHYIQLLLHTLCKHNIIFNSTYSWWAAWLNRNPNQVVISPDEWFTPGSGPPMEDILPDRWVKIQAKYGPMNDPESYN